jgi:HD domain
VLELAARLQDCAAVEDLGAAVTDALLTHVSADRVSFWATGGDGLTRLVSSAGVDAARLLASRPQPYRPSTAAPDVAALLRGDVWHSAPIAADDRPEGLPSLPAASSLMQVPILEDGTLRASISLTRVDGSPFSARDVSISRAFATQSALALRSWAARDEAERTIVATVEALVEALAAKDQYTSDHGLEVQHLTVETGVALGLGEEALAHLSQAAVLHDIGKIGVPLEVLHKPAALDATELALIRQHPILGERILAPVARLRAVIPLVRSSHERWDGQGYPDGLRAEAIPLGARIIAVVDAYSAMTTDRPYRTALPEPEARRELRENAGTQFDAAVVRAFLRVLDGAYTTAAGTP